MLGHYCVQGSSHPAPCPVGTNTSSTGLSSAAECQPCKQGYYCPAVGTVFATQVKDVFTRISVVRPVFHSFHTCMCLHHCLRRKLLHCCDKTTILLINNTNVQQCAGGYFCPTGTADPSAVASLICPKAHRCPLGSSAPLPCAAGLLHSC